MVCGEYQGMGDFLSRNNLNTNSRINILITICLERLSLVRSTMRFAQENEGDLERNLLTK